MIGGQTIGRIVLEDIVTILLNLPNGEMVVLKHIRHPTDHTVRSAGKDTGVRIIGIEAANRIIVTPWDDERLVCRGCRDRGGEHRTVEKICPLIIIREHYLCPKNWDVGWGRSNR